MNSITSVSVKDYSGLPVRLVLFGGGNFLRGFLGWMLDCCNEAGVFNGSVTVVEPIPPARPSAMKEQHGRYTVLRRGNRDGWQTSARRIVTTLRNDLNPYEDWEGYLALARLPELRFVASNTTEAGIAYSPCAQPTAGNVPLSYPAKLTAFLFERFTHFGGAADKGLLFMPCELIEHNGKHLKEYILRHAADWNLPTAFLAWFEKNCAFCNTLVDSIVPGFPAAETQKLYEEFGYEDKMLVATEIFNLLVIEAPEAFKKELPLEKSGANVVWTDDITPYRNRKVRVLNGGHTSCVLAAYLAGLDTVGEMLADEQTGALLRQAVFTEILPGLKLPEDEKQFFAEAVMQRFANPFIRHELLSISLNSTSKWMVRVLPSLKDYLTIKGSLPKALVFSWAALCAFYQETKNGDKGQGFRQPSGKGAAWSGGSAAGGAQPYPVNDSPEALEYFSSLWAQKGKDIPALVKEAAGNAKLWGEDLNALPGFAALAAAQLKTICEQGMRPALAELLA